MGARRLMSVVVVSSCVLACVLYCGASAFAVRGHVFSASFGAPGSGDGQLEEPSGVAVNESTGDVYVVDKGNGRVEEFSSAGAYIGEFNGSGTLAGEGSAAPTGQFVDPEAIAVDNSGDPLTDPSAGDVYVADNGHRVIDKFSSTGAYIGQLTKGESGLPFGRFFGIAIDQNGTLWVDDERVEVENSVDTEVPDHINVASFTDAVVNEFTSGSNPMSGYVFGYGFAVDSEDNLYADWFGRENFNVAAKSNSSGDILKLEIDPEESTSALSVDLSDNDLYVDNIRYISRYSPESDLIERFGSGILEGSAGVAVDASTGTVYVTDDDHDVVDDFEIEPFSAPVVENDWVTNVTSTSATFGAQINPRGSSTEYTFEYGPTTAYGTSAPVPDGSIASGFGGSAVGGIYRAELLPDTTYHYRVVAHNELGTVDGPDRTFTTQLAVSELRLPDGRMWELVSPPDKKGAVIEPFPAPIQAASNGSGIAYPAEGPAVGEGVQGKTVVSMDLSRRGPNGWGTDDIDMPRRNVNEGESEFALASSGQAEYEVFSPDLSSVAAEPSGNATPLLSAEATERTLYLRDDENGSFAPLVTPGNVPSGVKFGGEESVKISGNLIQRFIAATPDLGHVIFQSPLALTREAGSVLGCLSSEECGLENLYEWGGGKLQLVNILPDNKPTTSEAGDFAGAGIGGGSPAGGLEEGIAVRPVSDDGRWVAWTWNGGLYVRDMVAEKTFPVGGANAAFQAMSSDGSRVFFLENGDLHIFDTATDTQSDLTANHGAGEASGGVQDYVSDVSEDGSYVYFVATGVLAHGGVSGEDNLYMSHYTGNEWETTYIATLSHEDERSWYEPPYGSALIKDLTGVSSRVSPDGRYLAFMSDRSLTRYDNLDASSGLPDEEVYLYDSASNRLVCASCDPTGARPVGVYERSQNLLVDKYGFWLDHGLAGSIPGWDYHERESGFYQSRYLSDDGRLFFNSPDALVAQDTNGLEDVYEYEPPVGPGTAASDNCTTASSTFSERSGGCVSLISSGASGSESVFYDASENGDDVFFITTSRLTASDYDDTYDVYDAHVCSAEVPCVVEPVSPPPCTSGDSCKVAPSPQPEIFGPAPSATFSGVGNIVEEAKGAVKSKPKAKAKAKSKKHSKHKKHKAKAKAKKARDDRASRKGGVR